MTTKHSALIRYQNARRSLELSREACPHWEYLGEIEFPHDCCYDVLDANQELRHARDAYRKQENAS